MYAKLIQSVAGDASYLSGKCSTGLEPIDANCEWGGMPTWS
jgi:hypothetical protein